MSTVTHSGHPRCPETIFYILGHNFSRDQRRHLSHRSHSHSHTHITRRPTSLIPIAPPTGVVDDVFKTVTDAGLRLGMTLRPQMLTQIPSWNDKVPPTAKPQKYEQVDFFNADNTTNVQAYIDNIVRKASYAVKRWNASMFYVDTCGNKNGVLPFSIWDGVSSSSLSLSPPFTFNTIMGCRVLHTHHPLTLAPTSLFLRSAPYPPRRYDHNNMFANNVADYTAAAPCSCHLDTSLHQCGRLHSTDSSVCT